MRTNSGPFVPLSQSCLRRNEATLWKRWEHIFILYYRHECINPRRNEATLWKRWELEIPKLLKIFIKGRNEATLWKRWEPTSAVLTAALLATCRNEATLWKRWEHTWIATHEIAYVLCRNEATLWKRWEPMWILNKDWVKFWMVGMKPLSERDENRRAGLN